MKVRFKNKELENYYTVPLDNIKGKQKFSKDLLKQYKKKIQILLSIDFLNDLKQFRSLNFESLKGNREGEYSIRLNIQYRLIFEIEQDKNGDFIIDIILINEISKHYE